MPGTYASGEGEAIPAMTISGRPPVLRIPLDALSTLPGSTGFTGAPETGAQFAGQLRVLSVHAFVGAGNGIGTPAQLAVQAALLQGAGVPFAVQTRLLDTGNTPGPPPGRRPSRPTPRPGGWPRCRPPPGTPGSPPTWPRCGPDT